MNMTKTKLADGIWQGVLADTSEAPVLRVTHLESEVPGVTVTPIAQSDDWLIEFPVPSSAIADGIQTLIVSETSTGEVLQHITIASGEVLNDDLRSEVDLLRAELDLLKAAFRKHCREAG